MVMTWQTLVVYQETVLKNGYPLNIRREAGKSTEGRLW
jgi:hypothetical protein